MISLYNKSEGEVWADIKRTYAERNGVETQSIANTRQFISTMTHLLQNINPEASWLLIPHSENGVILKSAIEHSTPADREQFQKILHVFAVAPAECLPMEYASSAFNVYSYNDFITGYGPAGVANKYAKQKNYNVIGLNCISHWQQKNLFLTDHGFLLPTYSKAWKGHIDILSENIGFIDRGRK